MLPGSGGGLQARRQVDRIADRQVLHVQVAAHTAHHHQCRCLCLCASGSCSIALQSVFVDLHRLLDIQGSQHRPEGVIFVCDRRAEEGQHTVAQQLGDGAFVAVDSLADKRCAPETISFHSSGSSFSAREVEPTMSVNRMVTGLRSPSIWCGLVLEMAGRSLAVEYVAQPRRTDCRSGLPA